METLKLEKSTARKLFPTAPEWFKKVLNDTFGNECFTGKIIDRIKTYEDACQEAGVKPGSIYTALDAPDEVAYKEGWVPDWSNANQKKWWPWFKLSSGFGFAYSAYYYDGTITAVGSRLCFENEEKCTYVAKQFIDLYEEFLTIK